MFHPDFTQPILLMGDEDPLPQIRASAPPRYSYRTLELLARDFEDELKQVESVGKVTKVAIVQEAVYLLFSDANLAGYGLTPETVMGSIAARNAVIPGGTMRTEGRNFPVQLSGEYKTEQDMLGTVVGMSRGGAPVYLRDVFDVRRMYESPIPYKVDVLGRTGKDGSLDTRRAVMVAVEMRDGKIIRYFNEDVMKVVEAMKARMPEGLEFRVLSDQPTAVEHRIHHFVRCFIEAVVIVIIVGLFLMDWRSALVLATAIPLTVAMTLVGMQMLHIPLQQISIAALIIALGMLVDVPVVASDGINRELHLGEPRLRAAWLGPLHLRHPMVFGTLINIFAFLPLLMLTGDKGEFMKSLPTVVTLALAAAFLVSVTFTPLISYYVLRGQKGFDEGGEVRSFFLFRYVDQALAAVLPRYRAALEGSLKRPWLVLGVGYSVLALSLPPGSAPGQPVLPAGRAQPVVGGYRVAFDRFTDQHEGDGGPGGGTDQTPRGGRQRRGVYRRHRPPLLLQRRTQGTGQLSRADSHQHAHTRTMWTRLLVKLRQELDASVPGVRCVVKQLEQGPPVKEPIQIRLSGENLDKLRHLADQTAAELRAAGGYHVLRRPRPAHAQHPDRY